MKIKAFTAKGKTRSVSIASDNLLLAALLVLPLESSSSTWGGKLFYAIVILVIPGLVVLVSSALFQRFRLWQMGARPLSLQHGQRLLGEVEEAAQRCGLGNISVYWVPRNLTVGARVLGIFRKKLVLTGGLCVVAKRSPSISGSIVAHEIGHLSNGDTRLFSLISLLVIASLTNLLTGALVEYPFATFGTFVFIPLTIYLLRRREFIADCLAINTLCDRGVYLGLLLSRRTSHGMRWLHPSAAARCRAVLYSSPILKSSLWLIIAAFTLMIAVFENPNHSSDLTNQLLFGLPLPGLAILFEISKGLSKKRPSALEEEPSASSRDNWRIACTSAVDEALNKLLAAGDNEAVAILQRADVKLIQPVYWGNNRTERMRLLLPLGRRILGALVLAALALFAISHFLALAVRGPAPVATIILNDYVSKLVVMNNGAIVFLKGGGLYWKRPRDDKPTEVNAGAWVYDFNIRPSSTRLSVNFTNRDSYGQQTAVFDAISESPDLPRTSSVISGVFSPSGQLYAVADGPSTLIVSKVDPLNELFRSQLNETISGIAFSADDNYVAVGLGNRIQVLGLDGKQHRPILELDGSPELMQSNAQSFALDQHGKMLILFIKPPLQYGYVYSLSTDGNQWDRVFDGRQLEASLSTSGRLLAEETDNGIKILSNESEGDVQIPLAGFFPSSMIFSPDDKYLAVAASDPNGGYPPVQFVLQVWSTKGKLLACMRVDEVTLSQLGFSSDGHYLAVSSHFDPPGDPEFDAGDYASAELHVERLEAEHHSIRLYNSDSWLRPRLWNTCTCSWPWNRLSRFWDNLQWQRFRTHSDPYQ